MKRSGNSTISEQEKQINKLTDKYMERLKNCGFRVTSQRKTIIEILLKNLGKHLNVKNS